MQGHPFQAPMPWSPSYAPRDVHPAIAAQQVTRYPKLDIIPDHLARRFAHQRALFLRRRDFSAKHIRRAHIRRKR